MLQLTGPSRVVVAIATFFGVLPLVLTMGPEEKRWANHPPLVAIHHCI